MANPKERNSTKPGDVLKYCPSCGSNQFIFDASRSFACDTCGFHLYINSASAVAAIIENEKGEILLTIRAFEPAKGKLDLPGGFVDPMESAEEAVIREIKEELNLDVLEMKYLISYPNEYVFKGYSVYTTDLAFVCKVSGFEAINSNDDVSGYRFFKPEDVDFKDISSDSIRDILQYYLMKR